MLNQKIYALLSSNDRSASDLARHCTVSPQAVHQWLRGIKEPRRMNKERIAGFFGITLQELEFGPVLSLTPLPRSDRISHKASIEAAKIMISAELGTTPKSVEYCEGMEHRIISMLSGSKFESSYEPGSCQADAYIAGSEHGQRLIAKIQSK